MSQSAAQLGDRVGLGEVDPQVGHRPGDGVARRASRPSAPPPPRRPRRARPRARPPAGRPGARPGRPRTPRPSPPGASSASRLPGRGAVGAGHVARGGRACARPRRRRCGRTRRPPSAGGSRRRRSRAVTAASASGADAPAAMRSSRAAPSAGSVMFWLQAAPTRARAQAQRAATAGLDDITIAPSMPVRAQQPTSERVTAAPRSRHLDQPLRPRERLHDEAGEHRMHAGQALAEHAVDRLAVADVGQVDVAARRCARAPRRTRASRSSTLSITCSAWPAGSPTATFSRVSRSCATWPRR